MLDYLEQFSELERNYFDDYAYDTIWSLAYLFNQSNVRKMIEKIDFVGATVGEETFISLSMEGGICLGKSEVFQRWTCG